VIPTAKEPTVLMDELTRLTPNSPKDLGDSAVISTPQMLQVIQSFTGVKEIFGSFNLLYSGKRDGYSGEVFHQKCDGIPNTLTLYHLFGSKDSKVWVKLAAFTEDAWDTESGLKSGTGKCWIAILESSTDEGPCILKHCEGFPTINCSALLGPCFGEGDISVSGVNFT